MADILELSYSSSQICVASMAESSLNEHSQVSPASARTANQAETAATGL